MVITVQFSDNFIDLNKIVNSLENAEYEPNQFPGLVYRMKKPRVSFLIFSTGKMTCTGARNVEEGKIGIKKMIEILKKMGFKVRRPKIELQNIVASCKFRKPIDLNKVLELEGTEFDPEQFPGLVYRTKRSIVFLIFAAGKVVCIGARSIKQVKESIDYLEKNLRQIGAFKKKS